MTLPARRRRSARGSFPDLRSRARRIRMILMDVDGVLTDGRIGFLPGGAEAKFFDVRDGVGIHLARRAGLRTGIISGRSSEAVRRRAAELSIDELHQRTLDKLPVYRRILARHRLRDEQVCYLGDDWVDIPILRRVGLAVVPADADPEAARHAHLRTRHPGGRGAVREAVDLILRAQGKRRELLASYRDGLRTGGSDPPAEGSG